MCIDMDFFRFTFEFNPFLIVHSGVLVLFVCLLLSLLFAKFKNLLAIISSNIFQSHVFSFPGISDGISFRSLLESHMSLKSYSFFHHFIFSPLFQLDNKFHPFFSRQNTSQICTSSLCMGCANLPCIIPILVYMLLKQAPYHFIFK